MAAALRSGLAQIAAQTTAAPDPKGTFTHNVIARLVFPGVADQIVAMISGTAVYSAPLSTPLPAEIARTGVGGAIIGIDSQQMPALVGAKLSYDPASSTLRYAGAMTDAEQQALSGQLGALADAGAIVAAVTSLYQQPTGILGDSLGGLLSDPAAADTLLHVTPSIDGQLNPVQVDGSDGQVPPSAGPVVSTATAWKFGYPLEQLLPVLAGLLSHTLAKQTVADAFAMDAALTSALLEQALSSPATAVQPVISDLLALSDDGVTASFYSNATASGTLTSTTTLAGISVDGNGDAARRHGQRHLHVLADGAELGNLHFHCPDQRHSAARRGRLRVARHPGPARCEPDLDRQHTRTACRGNHDLAQPEHHAATRRPRRGHRRAQLAGRHGPGRPDPPGRAAARRHHGQFHQRLHQDSEGSHAGRRL